MNFARDRQYKTINVCDSNERLLSCCDWEWEHSINGERIASQIRPMQYADFTHLSAARWEWVYCGQVLAAQQPASRAQLLVAHSSGCRNFLAPGTANFSISCPRTAPVIACWWITQPLVKHFRSSHICFTRCLSSKCIVMTSFSLKQDTKCLWASNDLAMQLSLRAQLRLESQRLEHSVFSFSIRSCSWLYVRKQRLMCLSAKWALPSICSTAFMKGSISHDLHVSPGKSTVRLQFSENKLSPETVNWSFIRAWSWKG